MPIPDPDPNIADIPQALGDAELYHTLVGQLEDGIYMLDRHRRIHYWNSGAEKITGYRAHDVLGRQCGADLLMHSDFEGTGLCGDTCPVMRTMEDGKPHEREMLLRHRNGHCIPIHTRSLPVRGQGGLIIGCVEVFEETVAPGRVEWRALEPAGCLDKATGAVSRIYGEYKVTESLVELEKFGIPLGWLSLELDAADRLEHRYGLGVLDAAMHLIANTAGRNLASFDVLTRWTGTEFRVAAHNMTHGRLADLARKLVVLARCSSLKWWGDPLQLTISIGGGMAEPGDSLQSLDKRAVEACAASRAGGGNRATLARHGGNPGAADLPYSS